MRFVREHKLRPARWLFPSERVVFIDGRAKVSERVTADASKHADQKSARASIGAPSAP